MLEAYLVVRRLALANLVLVCRPEARAVRSEDLVHEHDLACLVETKLEFGVGDDDAALFGILPGLDESSQWLLNIGMRCETDLLVNQQTSLLNPASNALAHNLNRLVAGDVLVVLTLLGLSGRSPDGLLELLRLLET